MNAPVATSTSVKIHEIITLPLMMSASSEMMIALREIYRMRVFAAYCTVVGNGQIYFITKMHTVRVPPLLPQCAGENLNPTHGLQKFDTPFWNPWILSNGTLALTSSVIIVPPIQKKIENFLLCPKFFSKIRQFQKCCKLPSSSRTFFLLKILKKFKTFWKFFFADQNFFPLF